MIITGFVIVRLPQFNVLVEARDSVPVVEDIYYSGLKRCPWADVFDEDYFAKKMPENVHQMALAIDRSPDLTGISVCRDEVTARALLDYSNRHKAVNELIVIRSPKLEEIKGSAVLVNKPVEWLGFDCIALGEWSLIEAGYFRRPNYYRAWREIINKFGLFDDAAIVPAYAEAYEKAVEQGMSEPLAKESDRFIKIAVEVGRLVMPKA